MFKRKTRISVYEYEYFYIVIIERQEQLVVEFNKHLTKTTLNNINID